MYTNANTLDALHVLRCNGNRFEHDPKHSNKKRKEKRAIKKALFIFRKRFVLILFVLTLAYCIFTIDLQLQ